MWELRVALEKAELDLLFEGWGLALSHRKSVGTVVLEGLGGGTGGGGGGVVADDRPAEWPAAHNTCHPA